MKSKEHLLLETRLVFGVYADTCIYGNSRKLVDFVAQKAYAVLDLTENGNTDEETVHKIRRTMAALIVATEDWKDKNK